VVRFAGVARDIDGWGRVHAATRRYWVNRAQSRGYRPRYVREFWSLIFLCLYLLSVMALAAAIFVVSVYYLAGHDDAAKRLFEADCG